MESLIKKLLIKWFPSMKKYTTKKWTLKTICNFLIAKYRTTLYYNGFKFLIRKSVVSKFEKRLKIIPTECYYNSGCKKTDCECEIPDILFSPEACEGGCYPHFNLTVI